MSFLQFKYLQVVIFRLINRNISSIPFVNLHFNVINIQYDFSFVWIITIGILIKIESLFHSLIDFNSRISPHRRGKRSKAIQLKAKFSSVLLSRGLRVDVTKSFIFVFRFPPKLSKLNLLINLLLFSSFFSCFKELFFVTFFFHSKKR